MLARVADSLYWIGRYVERAEHMSRVADVMLNATLDEGAAAGEIMAIALAAVGDTPLVQPSSPYEAAESLALNRQDPASIVTSLSRARENARQVRDHMTAETWERLNMLHLRAVSPGAAKAFADGSSQFLQDTIADLHMFKGAADATLSHGEGWRFLILGVHLERAQLIGRLLQLFFADSDRRSFSEHQALTSLLRMSCALEPYLRAHTADLNSRTILQFLLFNEDFPRSIRFCTNQIEQHLSALARPVDAGRANPERLAGRLKARLQYADVETSELNSAGQLIATLLEECEAIHLAVYETFVAYPLELRLPA
jgi:uncharacterized alpha-E superfamily protein